LANIQRPLRRSTAIDPAELELSRTRTLDRLNAIADHEPTRTLDKGETDMADAPATNDANDPGVAGASQSAIEPTESRPFRWLRQPHVRYPSSTDHPPGAPPAVNVHQGEVPTERPVTVDPSAAAAIDREQPAQPSLGLETSDAQRPEAAPDGRAADVTYCPYCASALQPVPRASRKCPSCRNKIIVRRVDDRTVLLVEAALPIFETERRRIAEAERLAGIRQHWLDLARSAGASPDRVDRAAAEPVSEARVAAARAMYLSMVDRSFQAEVRKDRLGRAARIRFDQALILFAASGTPVPAIPQDPAGPSDTADAVGTADAAGTAD
jgi:hypothetical protein